ncbi:MAG: hypothetical protein ACOX0C_03140 [Patescibacteria group bacterium]|jgi:hypothetical protein
MNKSAVNLIIWIVAGVLVATLFIYSFFSLQRLDKNIIELQQTTYNNSAQVSAIVEFLNSLQIQANE